jgi:predicted SAM-dependent methyltransferase
VTTLDVGCGRDKFPGAVGADLIALPGVDVVFDMNQPWPFLSGSFQRILCKHSLEHASDLVAVMREIHRVASRGAVVEIIAPHFASDNFFSDPTHRVPFGYRTMNYFAADLDFQWNYYTTERFRIVARRISFRSEAFEGLRSNKKNPARWFGLEALVNRFPRIYERFFAFTVPASEVYFRLEVLKEA